MVAIPRYVSTTSEAAARIAGYVFGDGNPDTQDNQLGGPAFTFIGDNTFQAECIRCAGVLSWINGVHYRITPSTQNFRFLRSALYAALGITSPTHNLYYRALEPTPTFTPTRLQVEAFLASVIETEGQADSNPPKVFDEARGGTYTQRIDALVLTLNTQNLGAFTSGLSTRVNLAALDAFPMPLITAARYPGDTPANWPDSENPVPPPDTTPPAVPTGLQAVVGDGQVSLAWEIVTDIDTAGYRVFRDGVQVYSGATPAVLDTGLTNEITYSYTVASFDTTGNVSAQSAAITAMPTGPTGGGDVVPPDTPTGLTGSPAATQVSLTWTASVASDLASYRVYRGSELVATVAAPSTFYVDTGLTPETIYAYRLTAVDGAGNESGSTEFINVITQDAPVPPPPVTLGPFRITSNLGCADGYDVYVADRSGNALLRLLPFTGMSWGRVMDEVSSARIDVDMVNGPFASECCRAISGLTRWAYEIVVFRDGTQVWDGPVIDIILDGPNASIHAEDKMAWTKVRPIWSELDYPEPGEDAATIFNQIVTNAMAPDNVPGLVATATATGIRAVREYLPNPPQIAYDAIQELARTGVDYTMVGPLMVAGSFVVPTPPIAYLTDQSVVSEPRVEYLGSNVATQWFVTGDPEEDLLATFGGVDPTVGLVVRIAQEDEIRDQASLDQNARTRWELTSSTSVGSVTLELDPEAPLPLELAVPGAVVDLRLTDSCAPLIGQFRLKDLSVEVSVADGLAEQVRITVEPLGTEIVT